MSGTIRTTALTALVLALAAGTTALAAWAAGQESNAPAAVMYGSRSPCTAPIRKNPHAGRLSAAASKKSSKKKETCHYPCTPAAGCSETKAGDCGISAQCPTSPLFSSFWMGCAPPPPPVGMMPQVGYPQASSWMPPPPTMLPAPFPAPSMAVPATTCATSSPGQEKQYTVEMKMVDCSKGKKDGVMAMPCVTVLAGQSAEFSCGTNIARLWQKGVPANEMGHEGIQVNLTVVPEGHDRVRLTCAVWTSTLDEESQTDALLHESRCQTTQLVKLGELAKLNCDRLTSADPQRCCLELTVKECRDTPEAVLAPCAPAGCPEFCEPFEGCRMVEPRDVIQATHTAPACFAAGECKPMKVTTVEVPCNETGKQADACGPVKHLEIRCCGTKMTCEKTELKMPGFATLKLCCEDGCVVVEGPSLKATADSISTDEKGMLVLEGHVHVVSSKEQVNVKAGKVSIKLQEDEIIKTGVISCPELVQ